jgi:chlorophyllide a oxygenase
MVNFGPVWQVHLSEARVAHTLQKLAEMEMAVNDKLLEQKKPRRPISAPKAVSLDEGVSRKTDEGSHVSDSSAGLSRQKFLDVSGPVGSYAAKFKDFWYPVAFSDDIDSKTMVRHYFLAVIPMAIRVQCPPFERLGFIAARF